MEQTAANPDVYEVLKRYANQMDDAEWATPTAADEAWLQSVATQRSVIGSAHAQTWLRALGQSPTQEIIILPSLNRSSRNEQSTRALGP